MHLMITATRRGLPVFRLSSQPPFTEMTAPVQSGSPIAFGSPKPGRSGFPFPSHGSSTNHEAGFNLTSALSSFPNLKAPSLVRHGFRQFSEHLDCGIVRGDV